MLYFAERITLYYCSSSQGTSTVGGSSLAGRGARLEQPTPASSLASLANVAGRQAVAAVTSASGSSSNIQRSRTSRILQAVAGRSQL